MVAELPQEIIDRIIDEIALDVLAETRDRTRDVKILSLVSSKLHHRSRMHLFQMLEITSDNFPTWCRDVRLGREGPSCYITYIRYRPSWVKVERRIGPLEGLARSPSHISAFINLRTLHFAEISLQHAGYLTCFGGLVATVRELWFEDCQMDINQFVSFVRPFKNLERLRLMRPQCMNEGKLQHWDMAEPPPLKGTLEYHQSSMATSGNTASFIHELSLLPASFSTMVFRERLDTPTAANRLLEASRRTLTKLTLGHNCEVHFCHLNCDFWFTPSY
ncbi:hypothetical protein BDM02DRAFT_1885931 [Thelephora ganbajun]|uniref:Uncharacterized protein n=1 Tax=Thelephora ganbajun TaxID=370292 RepID=A0ACB6ZUM3_THEGA|nr:hypothetical protein BDM02DRAFT_1885931 [Thelephora ganbajun]